MDNLRKYQNTMRILTFVIGILLSGLGLLLILDNYSPTTHEITIYHILIVKLFGMGFLFLGIKLFQVLYNDFVS
jgi:hypothetical protein